MFEDEDTFSAEKIILKNVFIFEIRDVLHLKFK